MDRRTSGSRPCGGADPAALGTALSPPRGPRVRRPRPRVPHPGAALRTGGGWEGGRGEAPEMGSGKNVNEAGRGWRRGGRGRSGPDGHRGAGRAPIPPGPGQPPAGRGGHRGDPLPAARGERRRRSAMMEEFRLHGDPAGTARPLSAPGDGPRAALAMPPPQNPPPGSGPGGRICPGSGAAGQGGGRDAGCGAGGMRAAPVTAAPEHPAPPSAAVRGALPSVGPAPAVAIGAVAIAAGARHSPTAGAPSPPPRSVRFGRPRDL